MPTVLYGIYNQIRCDDRITTKHGRTEGFGAKAMQRLRVGIIYFFIPCTSIYFLSSQKQL